MNKLRLLALALLSSGLFALGLPNEFYIYGQPFLGYVSLVPLYLALASCGKPGLGALAAGLYGALHHGLSSYWLWYFKDFAFWTLGSSTIAYFFVYALFGGYAAYLLKSSPAYRPIAFALLWAAFEYQKSIGFLGYPWGLLPYTQTRVLSFLQIADTTGIYGISFILALANGVIAEWLTLDPWPSGSSPTLNGLPRPVRNERGRKRLQGLPRCGLMPSLPLRPRISYALFSIGLILAAFLYGAFRLSYPFPESPAFDALLIQQNIDPWYEGEEAGLGANIKLAREGLAAAVDRPGLILFSESSLGRPFEEFRNWYETRPRGDPLLPFIRESGAHLFTGAPIVLNWESFEATNSVILIDPKGRQIADYAKMHPVPFAEAIPFWEYEGFRRFMREKVGLESGWVMGSEYTLFELPTASGPVRFGAPICFEDAFSELCRDFALKGAGLLVNLTNDSWSRTVSAEIQHFAAARFRSIELRMPLLRSTNGGKTCLIGPHGEVRAELPLFEAAYLRTTIPRVTAPPSPFLLFGEWFAKACVLLSALWSLIVIGADLRERRKA